MKCEFKIISQERQGFEGKKTQIIKKKNLQVLAVFFSVPDPSYHLLRTKVLVKSDQTSPNSMGTCVV